MEIDDLEKPELVRMAGLLSERLGESIMSGLVLELRMEALEKVLDASRKEVFWENRAGQLSQEALGWKESAERAEAACEMYRANEKRLERELKECRATVMNEVSAMIPKAVEAERGDLMNVLRDSALKCDTAAQSNILMGLVNEIKARGK